MSRAVTGTSLYGNGSYIMPTDDDVGNDVFALLETYLERLALHDHTGDDSISISLNFTKISEDYVVGVALTWSLVADGVYRALVSISDLTPTYDGNLRTMFYQVGGGDWIGFNPRVERVSNTTYYVYSNDNTMNLRTVYY